MSATQKSCCMNRPTSVNECCQSATGSAMNRARDRSTWTLSAPSGSAFRWDGTTRSSLPSRTTSHSPSPLGTNQSSPLTSSVVLRRARSKRSRVDRGRLASGTAAPLAEHPGDGFPEPGEAAGHRLQ